MSGMRGLHPVQLHVSFLPWVQACKTPKRSYKILCTLMMGSHSYIYTVQRGFARKVVKPLGLMLSDAPSSSTAGPHQEPYRVKCLLPDQVALTHPSSTCRFYPKTATDEHSMERSIRVRNRAGACVSPHNISAASLHALNITSIAPEQWESFTTASSGIVLSCLCSSQAWLLMLSEQAVTCFIYHRSI